MANSAFLSYLHLGLILLVLDFKDLPERVLVVAAAVGLLLCLRHQLGSDVVAVRLRPQLLLLLPGVPPTLVRAESDSGLYLRHEIE